MWNAGKNGTKTLRYKNPFDENDFHEYYVEIKPMRFSVPPVANPPGEQIQAQIADKAAGQATALALPYRRDK